MTKKIYKIIEIIGIMIIAFLSIKIFPYLKNIIKLIFKILLPFIISFSIAFIFEPLIEKLETKKINRKISIFVISLFFMLIVFLLIKYGIPSFINKVEDITKILPEYMKKISNIVENINDKFEFIFNGYTIDYDKIESIISSKLTEYANKITSSFQMIFSYIIVILVTPILTIYFMHDFKKIEELVKNKLIKNNKDAIYEVFSKSKDAIMQYFKGIIIIMFILTLATTITFLFLKLDYPLLFGFIIGITDIIPYLGPYIGGAIVVLFVFVSTPKKIIFVIISIVILQFIESNFLVPKVQSKTLKTNPILVILSVTFFGEIMGIFGMLIAVPFEKIVEIVVKTCLKYKKI